MRRTTQCQDDLWNDIWAEYDASRQVQASETIPAPPVRRRRPRFLRFAAAACLMGLVVAYAGAPFLAAATLGEALAAGDAQGLEQRVDWASLGPQFAASLNTQPLSPQADRFLGGMARDVAQGMASPEGLLGLVRDRLPRGAGGFGMIGAVRPLDARHWQVALHAPGEADSALHVTLALQDPLRMRWQVVGMELPPRRAEWGL